MNQETGAVRRLFCGLPHALQEKVFFDASRIGINVGEEDRN
jgi:hypothetical protein